METFRSTKGKRFVNKGLTLMKKKAFYFLRVSP